MKCLLTRTPTAKQIRNAGLKREDYEAAARVLRALRKHTARTDRYNYQLREALANSADVVKCVLELGW